MAITNPTTLVSASLGIILSDLLGGGAQILNRATPVVSFKSQNVQYQGYITLPVSTNITLSPVIPVTTFAVVYLRNAGPNNVAVLYSSTGGALTNSFNLDNGAMFLYISPILSSVAVGGISSGIGSVQIVTNTTTTSVI